MVYKDPLNTARATVWSITTKGGCGGINKIQKHCFFCTSDPNDL